MFGQIAGAIVLAFAAAVLPVAAQETAVPLKMFDGLPLVPVSIDHKGPRWFVVDTGTTTTTLSDRFARELGLTATARASIETTAGSVTAWVGAAESVRVGTVELGRGEIVWQPIEVMRLPAEVEGILGFDRLASVNFLLDYRSRTLKLDPGGELVERLKGEETPFIRSLGRPVIDALVRVPNAPERTRRLVVDSGVTTPVLLDRLRDVPAMRTLVTTSGTTAAASTDMSLTLGRATLPRTAAVIVEPRERTVREDQGLLPASLFAWMYFDVGRNVIVWRF